MQLCQLVEHLHSAFNHVIKHPQLGNKVWQLLGTQMDRLKIQIFQQHKTPKQVNT